MIDQPEIHCFEVTLVYKDNSTWFAGGFPSQEAVNTWVANEQKQLYWDEQTQVQIVQKY